MTIEIRPATADELPELKRLLVQSLGLPMSNFTALDPDFTLCVFDDGRPAAAHGSWPLTMRFNGKALPISGVTTVATDVIDRQKGYLRKLVTQHFEELHEQGERPLAVLFASQAAIYQRYGYAVVSTAHEYSIEPRYLQFNEPMEVPGQLRHIDPEPEGEFGLLVGLYREFREGRTGYVHRGKPMWDGGVLSPPTGEQIRSSVVYEEDGEAQGYCLYRTSPGTSDPPEPNLQCIVDDLVWLNARAYRAFWENLSKLSLTRRIEWSPVPPDDPLPHQLLEPRQLRDRLSDQLMARVVDIPGAFRGRGYQESDVLRFAVSDDLCPWNSGQWQVLTGVDDAEVTSLSAGNPDVTLAPGTLAMLLFGQISATEAARAGKLDVHDESALARWDKTLRTIHKPFASDHW